MTRFELPQIEQFCVGLDHSEGIAATADGQIYVGGEAGQIFRLNPVSGSPELVAVLPGEGLILGLAARTDGSLLACDASAACIWSITPSSGDYQLFCDASEVGQLTLPNWGCFVPNGNFLFTDSGSWKGRDGKIMSVGPQGGIARMWSDELRDFPNGMALSEDQTFVWVLESTPGRLWKISFDSDGEALPAEFVTDIPGVPDGVAVTAGGGVVISNYRPDVVWLWTPHGGLEKLAEDPEGTVLASPTNVLFAGKDLTDLIWPNLGRWHVSVIRSSGIQGVPVHLG